MSRRPMDRRRREPDWRDEHVKTSFIRSTAKKNTRLSSREDNIGLHVVFCKEKHGVQT